MQYKLNDTKANMRLRLMKLQEDIDYELEFH